MELKEKKVKKLPLSIPELIYYCVCAALGLWGLTFIVLGLVANGISASELTTEPVALVEANNNFKSLDFLGWGMIILAIAAVLAVILLLVMGNKVDRDYEKNVRRAQRLAQLEAEVAKEEAAK